MAENELKAVSEIKFTEHYNRMWPFVKPYWIRALVGILLCIPIGALDSVVALALKPYMDLVLVDKTDRSPAYIPLLIVAFTTVQGFLNYAATYLNTWVGTKINQDLKRALFKKLLSLEIAFYDKNNSGYIMQRFSSDADMACTGLLDNLKVFISRLFSSLSLICVLIYNSWQLSIIAIVVLGCALLPLASVKRRIKFIVLKNVTEASKVFTNYNETYSGAKTIYSYNLQQKIYNKFDNTLRTIFKLTMKMVQKTAWMTPLMHIIISVGIGGVIGYGSYLIVNGTITSGNFVSFITALVMLYTPIKGIGKNFNNVQISFLAIERVMDILDMDPAVKDRADARVLKQIEKGITFDDVTFEYVPGTPVLKNVSLNVRAGSTVAVVGNSGGGKTTLVNLLPRFYDVKSGAVKIDGQDIRSLTMESLRDKIAVVFQDNFLFEGTIRDNITLGKENASDEEIAAALKMAYLDDFVAGLENGVDTEIGERGALLSGGQRQRLAIARAFIKNAPIVILDEATSALDNKSEAVVQKAIDNLMQDRTVFVIAHRLSTVQNADKIVVVNDGQIVEEGTHDELLAIDNGAYKALYNAQFKKKAA
ncbi:MAG: ABC transporter ATP-binding protein [Azospirillum sp.]|jgi:lipid A export ATP-binding/permease protein msbA|uniref:ABC transporter ATP-binding protein n=1 Tax=Candidatus Scatocola faecigallinarum TaxID=2840916 RepID=UPI00402A40DA|nr:ABC transporter ATP-binding protein [Azospirillum sp.]